MDDEAFMVDLEEVAEHDVKQVALVHNPAAEGLRGSNLSLQMIEKDRLKQIILYLSFGSTSSFVSGSSSIKNKKTDV